MVGENGMVGGSIGGNVGGMVHRQGGSVELIPDPYTKGIPLPRILNYRVQGRDSRSPHTTYQEAVDHTQRTPRSFSDPTHVTRVRLPNSTVYFKHALWCFHLSTL
jgi:hypothetical protein